MTQTKNIYQLPIKKEDIIKTTKDSPAHKGKLEQAVDFLCDEGKEVLAALDGEVVLVKDDSNVGGPDKKYWDQGNRIVIKHENDEFSAYEHLQPKGVKVKVGQKVKQGDSIGLSGNTGYSFAPHLHFEVFVFTGPNKQEDYECLEIKFKE